MKIILNDYNIAGGDINYESPQNLKISTKNEVQIFRSLRADFIKTAGRGNVQTQISFDINRRHNSQAEAELYALQHASKVINETGVLKIIIDGHASHQGTIELHNASVLSVYTSFKNNASFTSYVIIGGEPRAG